MKAAPCRRKRSAAGFTLVEVVVASAILAIAMLAAMTAFSFARQAASVTENRLACAQIAREAMERLKNHSYHAPELALQTTGKPLPGYDDANQRGYYIVENAADSPHTKDITVVVEWMEPRGTIHSVSLTSSIGQALHK